MALNYNRTFIALKNDRTGYGANSRIPSGRCIIETRGGSGKISVSVQDLKTNIMYKCYIINNGDNRSLGVPIGTLVVDAKGKGDLKYEFLTNDVGGTMVSIEHFNVIAIMVGGDKELTTPLIGYRNDKVNWKNNFTDHEHIKQEPPTKPSAPEETPAKHQYPIENHEPEMNLNEPSLEKAVPDNTFENIDKPPVECIDMDTAPEEPLTENMSVEAVVEKFSAEDTVESPPVENLDFDTAFAKYPMEDVKLDTAFEKDPIEPVETETEDTADSEDACQEAPDIPEDTEPCPKDAEPYPKDADFFDNMAEQEADDQVPDETIHETFKAMAQKFNKELQELEHLTFLSDEEIQALSSAKMENAATEDVSAQSHEAEPIGGEDELTYLFQNNIEMAPFKKQNRDIRWIRISIRELALLPLDYWSFMNEPFVVSAHKKYNHLIMGVEADQGMRQYYLGIPASYEVDHKSKARKLGFFQFKVCDRVLDSSGEYGYWLRRV